MLNSMGFNIFSLNYESAETKFLIILVIINSYQEKTFYDLLIVLTKTLNLLLLF